MPRIQVKLPMIETQVKSR